MEVGEQTVEDPAGVFNQYRWAGNRGVGCRMSIAIGCSR